MDNQPPRPLLTNPLSHSLHPQRIQRPLVISHPAISRLRPNAGQITIEALLAWNFQPIHHRFVTLRGQKPRPAPEIVIRELNQQFYHRISIRACLRRRQLTLRQPDNTLRVHVIERLTLHVARALARMVRRREVMQCVLEVAGLEGEGAEHGGLGGDVADVVGGEGVEDGAEGLVRGAAFERLLGVGAGV